MKRFTKKELQSLPKYIRFGEKGCAMRLYNPEFNRFPGWRDSLVQYHRDAGAWSVDVKIDKKTGKIYSICQGMKWLHNVELIPTTYADWKKDNQGYISKGDKAYNVNDVEDSKDTKDEIPF